MRYMLEKKYQEILRNLENYLKNKEDLQFVKEQFSNLSIIFTDEMTKVEQKYEARIKALENKIDSVENAIKQIEADLYEGEDVDLEPINCPYCGFNFLIAGYTFCPSFTIDTP